MATNYSPTIVTDGAVFVGDALMPSTATSATKLYNRAGSDDGTMYTGGCCNFDGTDDDIFTTSDLTLSGAFAISVWVKGNGSSFGSGWVISNKSGGPVNLAMRLVGSPPKIQYYYYSGAWRSIYSTASVSVDTWTHLVMSRTSGNYVSFYINGELDSTTQAEDAGGVTGNTVNGPVNVVGGYWSTGVFSGSMADFKVFNTNLSSAQVKEMYDDSKVIIPTGIEFSNLDLWYSMNEGVGTIAYDGSGLAGSANNPGIGQNFNNDEFLTGQTGCPQLITGYNRPLKFASGDYVNVPVVGGSTGPLAIGTNDFTVCGWWFGDPSQTQGPNLFMQFSGAGGWRLVATSSPAYRFSIFDNGWSNYAYKDVNVTLGTWQHIAVSCDRDGTAVCYLNGSASGSALDISSVTGSLTNSDPLRIGNGNYTNTTPSSDWTYGVINECMIFNGIALNATDIAALAATDANGGPLTPDPRTMSFNTSGYSTSHLKGYWRNTGNSTWTDDSGNSNTGTVYGGSKNALTFIEGYNGNKNVNSGRDSQGFPLKNKNVGAAGFNGSDTSLRVSSLSTDSNSAGILASENLTISVWVKPIDKDSPSLQGVVTNNSTGAGRRDLDISSGAFVFYNGQYANSVSSSTAECQEGVWQQVVVTSQTVGSAALMKMFVDGTQVDEKSRTDTIPVDYATNGFYLGYLNSSRYFNGQIGPVQVYDRALTLKEIRQNYNAQKSRFT